MSLEFCGLFITSIFLLYFFIPWEVQVKWWFIVLFLMPDNFPLRLVLVRRSVGVHKLDFYSPSILSSLRTIESLLISGSVWILVLIIFLHMFAHLASSYYRVRKTKVTGMILCSVSLMINFQMVTSFPTILRYSNFVAFQSFILVIHCNLLPFIMLSGLFPLLDPAEYWGKLRY